MQIFASKSDASEQPMLAGGKRTESFEAILSPLSLSELSQLRSNQDTFGASLPPDASADEIEEAVTRLRLTLRAKMASLHRMNVLSLPIIASKPAEADAETEAAESPANDSSRGAGNASKFNVRDGHSEKLAALNEKVDNLTAKIDALLEAQTRTSSPARRARGDAALSDAHRRREVNDTSHHALNSALSMLNIARLTNPTLSLAIIILSLALLFSIMKSSIE